MLMPNEADNLKTIDIDQRYYALIPSRFPTIALYSRIANGRDVEVAEIETLTNPRLRERERILNGMQVVDVNSPLLQNWNHAPFTYANPEGSRFFGPEIPVLELAEDLQTALAISVRKREEFLSRTKELQTALEMRVLVRGVRGNFADGQSWNSELNLKERRMLGAAVLQAGLDGLIYRPIERPTATCVAILKGSTLDRSIQGDHFKFVWDGVKVSAIYDFNSGKAFTPDQLRLAQSVLAA